MAYGDIITQNGMVDITTQDWRKVLSYKILLASEG